MTDESAWCILLFYTATLFYALFTFLYVWAHDDFVQFAEELPWQWDMYPQLHTASRVMGDIYHSHKDADGFLYVYYTNEPLSTAKRMYPFKGTHSLEQRIQEAEAAKATQKVPVICERTEHSSLPDITKKKFLAPPSMTIGTLSSLLRKMIATEISEPFYLFADRALLSSSTITIEDLYFTNKDSDGLLYITYDNVIPRYARQIGAYKASHPLEERTADAAAAAAAGKIPVICEKVEGSPIADLKNKRFIVPLDMSVGTFTALLQKRISVEIPQEIYLFLGSSVLTASSISMSDIYNTHKDDDGLLYVSYADEPPATAPQIGYYKGTYTKRERISEAEKARWLEKVPIFCERAERSNVPLLEQQKFFVSHEMTVQTFIKLLEKRIATELNCPIFLFIEGHPITCPEQSMAELYAKHKDDDKFLYVTYSSSPSITR